MKYILEKDAKFKKVYISYKTVGMEIIPKNSVKKTVITASKMTLVDQTIIDDFVHQKINRKFNKLFKEMYYLLKCEDDNSSEDTGLLLDEIARLKSVVINQYKEYISEKEYRDILKKLIIAEEEFAKSYLEKKVYNNFFLEDYDEEYENDYDEERQKSR